MSDGDILAVPTFFNQISASLVPPLAYVVTIFTSLLSRSSTVWEEDEIVPARV
ncbi:hypothetical protein [Methanoculleus bourgensis]|uniref:hypothetical protein n=1 Tax=Methanoculleus bourgensis TaxID=83986 RepID=UPI0012F6FC85|nr:hypothetical protein [Methanoculleus bourgensis]